MSSSQIKFKDFIKYYDKDYYSLSLMNNPSNGSWNPKRRDYLKQHNGNRKSFLLELEEIEANSVSDLVPKEFFSPEKSKLIFSNFLKELSKETYTNKKQILTIESCPMIAEQKEEYETIKRNLIKYIDYIMNKNFYLIRSSAKNLNPFYIKIEQSLLKIGSIKKKFGIIKKKYFLTYSQIYLKKQKLYNCKNIYNNLLKLREYKKMYLNLTNTKSSNDNNETNNKLQYNKNIELIKKIENFKYYNKSLICFWFIQNLKINKNDCLDNYEELLSKLFLSKISVDEFNSLYDIFISINNSDKIKKSMKNINEELLNKLKILYKKNILKVFKGILLSYATIDYSETLNSNTISKLKQLQSLSFEEKKLFLAINQICLTILTLCDNLDIYIFNKEYRNTKFGQVFYINRKLFYDILNKKIRKILFLYTDLILNLQDKKYIYLILSSFSLIYTYIEKTFQISNNNENNNKQIKRNSVINNNNNNNNKNNKDININGNKYIKKNTLNNQINNYNTNNNTNNKVNNINQTSILKNEIYNFYIKLTTFELKQNIKNLALYLNKDNWKRINIINLNDQLNKKYIRIIKYNNFLNLPFIKNNTNKNEIKEHITNLCNFKESKSIKLNIHKLFNKKLNERNLVFSSSSFNLFFYIFELMSYTLIVPSIKKKIILDIFNLYDYFIYSTILMFNYDKINLEKLQQKKINKNENINNKMQNNNEIIYNELIKISKDMEYFQNYMNLIPFLSHCKKEVLIKIIGDEKILFTILPSLSPIILNNNTNEDKNKINRNNFIEKIICYECYWTLFKIIKRIIPTNNNEIYLTQINKYKIILNEIRHFLYYPISANLIKNRAYIDYFINFNWVINSNNNNLDNKKINVYIQIIMDNLKDINNKINMFLPISLKSKIRFIIIVLDLMINDIKENLDKIKNINEKGLNLLIQDFKLLQKKIYEFINSNDNGNENKLKNITFFDEIFNKLYEYFNNIISNKNIFFNSVGKNKIALYLANGLLNLNKVISIEDKKKIKVDLKNNCLKEKQIIDRILIKYN